MATKSVAVGTHGRWPHVASYEEIVQILMSPVFKSCWPNSMVVILPSTPATSLPQVASHKVHVIDLQSNIRLLGTTYITAATQKRLRSSNFLKPFNIARFTNNTSIISRTQQQLMLNHLVENLSDGEAGETVDSILQQLKQCLEPQTAFHRWQLRIRRLLLVYKRIKDTKSPKDKDMKRFFYCAEQCFLQLFVHPDSNYAQFDAQRCVIFFQRSLNYRITDEFDEAMMARMRMQVECFMPHLGYVGEVSIEARDLQRKLQNNGRLRINLRVVSDVCEIMPLMPPGLTRFVRNLCSILGLEIIYNFVGQFSFKLYKHYLRMHSRVYDYARAEVAYPFY